MTPITIGNNVTVYCAPCEAVLSMIGPVDAAVFDPPYLFNSSGGGKMRKTRPNMDNIAAAGMDEGFDINILNPSFYKSIVSFCHNDQLHTLLPWFAENYRRHVVCSWIKTNPMPVANRNYQANVEPYIHAWQKDAHPVGSLADLKRTITTTNGKSDYDHPTVKPLEVMEKIMRNVNGETVIDMFMGTGSTGVAALRHGKKFIGIERDPKYFAIALRRLADEVFK